MRLFVAIGFSEAQQQEIHEAISPFRAMDIPVRWEDSSRYHLTLKFLGSVREDRRQMVENSFARIAGATRVFPLILKGLGAFPSIRLPETLWMGVDPTPPLRCLKQDLEWGLVNLGFERDVQAFHPHVTVGRATAAEGAGAFRGLDDAVTGFKGSLHFQVEALSLVRSLQTKEGRVYSTVATAPLRTKGRRG
jgi:2'-5' RNA ligase